jgi:hypothetical protein
MPFSVTYSSDSSLAYTACVRENLVTSLEGEILSSHMQIDVPCSTNSYRSVNSYHVPTADIYKKILYHMLEDLNNCHSETLVVGFYREIKFCYVNNLIYGYFNFY